MKIDPPRFELTRVLEDGTREEPQIVPVTALLENSQMDRRGFLGAGVALSAVGMLGLTGCATKNASVNVYDEKTQSWRTSTLPCGSPIPPGATCTCNCVPTSSSTRGSYGTRCTCNKVCTCVPVRVPSDRQLKENIHPIDDGAILARLADVPLSSWNYRDEGAMVRHIGPMAQDFASAFGLGDSERHICMVDGLGVALAAIQALQKQIAALDREVGELRRNSLEGRRVHGQQRFNMSLPEQASSTNPNPENVRNLADTTMDA